MELLELDPLGFLVLELPLPELFLVVGPLRVLLLENAEEKLLVVLKRV